MKECKRKKRLRVDKQQKDKQEKNKQQQEVKKNKKSSHSSLDEGRCWTKEKELNPRKIKAWRDT